MAALIDLLADRFRVIAADLYGCGRSPAWPGERPMWIDDQLALLEPVFERAGERFHVVGHSYGGAIALKAALKYGSRVRSLARCEPVLFALLLREAPQSDAARGILQVRDQAISAAPCSCRPWPRCGPSGIPLSTSRRRSRPSAQSMRRCSS